MRLQSWTLLITFGSTLGVLAACKPKADPTPPQTPIAEAPPPAPTRVYPEPPTPGPVTSIDFPSAEQFTLPNGLVVYVVPSREVPIVSAQLIVRCGTMDRENVPEFVSSMLGEGTSTRTKAQIDETIEFVGGALYETAGVHVSYVVARVLSRDLKLGLTLIADEVMNPVFPDDALAKLKEQAKGSLRLQRTEPEYLAEVLFDQVAYPPGHPYGRPMVTEADIDAITLEDIKAFHSTFYRANNAFLVLAGDVDVAAARELTTAALGRWSPAEANEIPPNPLNRFTDYQVAKDLTVHVVDRPGSTQTEIVVGNLALARGHEDWPKLVIASSVLGGDMSSRLFMDVREKRGLVYGIESTLTTDQAPGTFTVRTRTRTPTTGATLAVVLDHLRAMRNEAPSTEEVATETKKLVGRFPLELETPEQIAGKVRETLVFNLPADYWSHYRDELASVTPAAVHTAARKYMHGAPHIVMVGEGDAIVAQLNEVLPDAAIKRYDALLQPAEQADEARGSTDEEHESTEAERESAEDGPSVSEGSGSKGEGSEAKAKGASSSKAAGSGSKAKSRGPKGEGSGSKAGGGGSSIGGRSSKTDGN